MNLNDIMTLREVADTYNIPIKTLQSRLKNLLEGEDYRRLGQGQSTILSPNGVNKLIQKM